MDIVILIAFRNAINWLSPAKNRKPLKIKSMILMPILYKQDGQIFFKQIRFLMSFEECTCERYCAIKMEVALRCY